MIWLLRHGEAEAGDNDDARRLTETGEAQAENAGRALVVFAVRVAACLSSPKARALDTARITGAQLGVEPEPSDALAGRDFDPEELAGNRDEVLLVGHEPAFSRAIARTTGARTEIKKGGLAAVQDGVLLTLLRPDQLEAIARRD